MIVGNDVTQEGAGFDVDTNVVTLFLRDGADIALPKMSKREVADRIYDEMVRLRRQSEVGAATASSNPSVNRS